MDPLDLQGSIEIARDFGVKQCRAGLMDFELLQAGEDKASGTFVVHARLRCFGLSERRFEFRVEAATRRVVYQRAL